MSGLFALSGCLTPWTLLLRLALLGSLVRLENLYASDLLAMTQSIPVDKDGSEDSKSKPPARSKNHEQKARRHSRSQASEERHDGKDVEGSTSRFWFPDWPLPEFDWYVSPIVGLEYQSTEQKVRSPANLDDSSESYTQSRKTLIFELGGRLGLMHVPIVGRESESPAGRYAMTLSPRIGYAFGQIEEVENTTQTEGMPLVESKDSSRSFHRVLVGADTTHYWSWFRYTLGVDFGRLIGEEDDGFPLSQIQVAQDFAIKILRRVSGHLTLRLVRVTATDFWDFRMQYTDLWTHIRFVPFHKFAFDIGPGVEFYSYPPLGAGSSSVYARADFDWPLILNLGFAGHAKYVFDSELDVPLSPQLREPLGDIGAGSKISVRGADSLDALFFFGLRDVLPGWSIGYILKQSVENTFERRGSRRINTTQGLGVHLSAAF